MSETAMAYTLEQFCAESRAILKSKPLASALTQMADRLSRLLANPAFVTEAFNADMKPGKRVLHHAPELDFYVTAHVQEGGKIGKPRSHGSSWAIYGNARAVTQMTEWRRTNPESEDHAELVAMSKYSLAPGQTHAYGPDVIHSTAHPNLAWVIRITGTDLDKLPRYHFGKTDKILESA
jgi:predicted metal-dependent enzyme (double-stranded beta helix superfamily)